MIQNIKGHEGMSLIFDIKKYVVGRQKFEDFGYALFPLFDVLETDEDKNSIELYINSGIYSVIIYILICNNSFQYLKEE